MRVKEKKTLRKGAEKKIEDRPTIGAAKLYKETPTLPYFRGFFQLEKRTATNESMEHFAKNKKEIKEID